MAAMPYRDLSPNTTSRLCLCVPAMALPERKGWSQLDFSEFAARSLRRVAAVLIAGCLLTIHAGQVVAQVPPDSALDVSPSLERDAGKESDAQAEHEEIANLKQRIADLEAAFDRALNAGTLIPAVDVGAMTVPDASSVNALLPDQRKKDAPEAKSDPKKPEGWKLRMGGHVQMDYVTWADADPSIPDTSDYFLFRRLRLLAEGTGYENFDFRFQMTLEPDNALDNPQTAVLTPLVKDAYFSVNDIPWLGRFRIGNFFVPYGLEQVTNDTFNIFSERSIPTQGIFTADREVGMALYNKVPSERISWATGVFLDSISEGTKKRIDDNQGLRVSGRVNWLPYYDEPSEGRYLIHTGLGILYTNDQDDRVRFRARPQVFEGPRLIDSGVLFADSYTTGNFEAAIVYERFTVQAEGYLCGIDFKDGESKRANGAYVHFSWFLTGESRKYERFGQHGAQFGRNTPFRNFSVTKNGFSPGAIELKARWSHFGLNDLNAGQYNDATFGFNWYWTDRTRVMFDWIHPITSATTLYGATSSDLIATRFDFNW